MADGRYWDAMALLRQEGSRLIAPFVAPGVVSCAPSVDIRRGDNTYSMYCTGPALTFNVAGSGAAEHSYCFPQDYFHWCQLYLRTALRNKPAGNDSVRERVLWVLDVWAHLVYGLLALNIDLRSGVHLAGAPTDNWLIPSGPGRSSPSSWSHPVYGPFRGAQAARYRSNEFLRTSQQPTLRTSAQNEWRTAVMMPTPFFELPFDWISQLGAGGVEKDLFPLWAIFYSGVLPWEEGGLRLQSDGGKDSAEILAAQNSQDYALMQGLRQWRIWCLQDWGPRPTRQETPLGVGARAWDDWWPLNMGRRNDSRTLSQYMVRVANESDRLRLVPSTPARLYPTFQVAFEDIGALVNPFLSLNYATALQQHMALWAAASVRSMPRSSIPTAITWTDSNDIVKAHADAVQRRAELAVTNPRMVREQDLAAGNREGALEQASQDVLFEGVSIGGSQVIPPLGDLILSNPLLAPFVAPLQRVMLELVQAVGAATGGAPTWALIPHPFVRTLTAAGWNTLADGSTVDVIPKLIVAVVTIEVATGIDMGVYSGPWQRAQSVAATSCRVVNDAEGNFVRQCDVPTAAQAADAAAFTQRVRTRCRALFDRQRMLSAYSSCLTDADYPAFEAVCAQMLHGQPPYALDVIAPEVYFEPWAAEVTRGRNCRSQGSLWASFVTGFVQRGNPLQIFKR